MKVAQSLLTLCNPTDCSPPGSSLHTDSPGKNTGVGGHTPPGDLPNPGIKPSSPKLQMDSLLSEPPGKPIARLDLYILNKFSISLLISAKHKEINFQFSSVAQSCLTLCDPMDCSTPGLPVHRQLSEFTQTHVHGVGDAIQPSHPLSSPSCQSFPASGSFQMSQFFALGGQSIGVSASTLVLPINIQD